MKSLLKSVVAILVFAAVAEASVRKKECAMWVAPSTVPGAGRGIIAGRAYAAEEVIDVAVSMTVPAHHISHWQLQNYVYASEEAGQSMVLFGVGMLFNHLIPASVHHYWDTLTVANTSDNKFEPSTTYSEVAHNTTVGLVFGQEIFTSYGDDEWFSDRGISLDNSTDSAQQPETASSTTTPVLLSEEDLAKHGHCITDVYVDKSDKGLGGWGLYAGRDFAKGELVSISPVLTLPKEEVEAIQEESVFMNYCIAPSNSSVALFPVGYSALVNHDKNPNMVMEWYSWPNDPPGKLESLFTIPVEDLLAKEFAQLDIAFRATRDIEANSELTIHYGLPWLEEWAEYLSYRASYHLLDEKEQQLLEKDDARPLFRAFIGPPDSLLWPQGWVQTVQAGPSPATEGLLTPKNEL